MEIENIQDTEFTQQEGENADDGRGDGQGAAINEEAAAVRAEEDFSEGADAPAGGAENAGGESEKHDADGKKQDFKTEKNSEAAERRRENERKRAEEIKAAELRSRNRTILESFDENPYTHKPMKDDADVEEFLTMREMKKRGLDPVADFADYQKQQVRERAERQATEDADRAKQDEWFARDRADFAEKHPDVDLRSLIGDEKFNIFAEGKVGNIPLSKIYDDYKKFTSELSSGAEAKAQAKAKQAVANHRASPGSLGGGARRAEPTFYTPEQVRRMSPAQVRDNYDKIVESMKKWS